MKHLYAIGMLAIAALLCSCGKTNPHRQPVEPFAVIDTYQRSSDFVDSARFEYAGRSIDFEGEIEVDRKTDRIRLIGRYRTTQDLEDGAALAIQAYSEAGELQVRDLPRIPLARSEDGAWVAEWDRSYSFRDWGMEFSGSSALIQFNYIQEGEYWYDIRYPDIELPSILFRKITPIERFKTVVSWIPPIVPAGVESFFPAIARARKTHDETFQYKAAMDVFSRTDKKRREQLRSEIASSISLGGDRYLVIGRTRLDEHRQYQVRHGFVWDGVRWYEDSEDIGWYRLVRAIPAWLHWGIVAGVFAMLRWLWLRTKGWERKLWRIGGRSLVLAIGVILVGAALTNIGIYIFAACLAGWRLYRSHVSADVRRYSLLLLLFSLMEIYWGRIYAQKWIEGAALATSILVYSIWFFPVFWLRSRAAIFTFAGVNVVCLFAYYIVMDLYAEFFGDYPTVRVLGYTNQVMGIGDSIWNLLSGPHCIALSIAIGFGYWFVRIPIEAGPELQQDG